MMYSDKEDVKELLRNDVVKLVFTKSNGEKREMKATLLPEYMPEPDPNYKPKAKKVNPDVQAVWDVHNRGFRSFRWDSLLEVEGADFIYVKD